MKAASSRLLAFNLIESPYHMPEFIQARIVELRDKLHMEYNSTHRRVTGKAVRISQELDYYTIMETCHQEYNVRKAQGDPEGMLQYLERILSMIDSPDSGLRTHHRDLLAIALDELEKYQGLNEHKSPE